MQYNTTTLPNGLRIIHLPSTSPVVYCGYQIAAGTRSESAEEEGLAHFCEHVTFKGTARRNALQIINALEKESRKDKKEDNDLQTIIGMINQGIGYWQNLVRIAQSNNIGLSYQELTAINSFITIIRSGSPPMNKSGKIPKNVMKTVDTVISIKHKLETEGLLKGNGSDVQSG